jgi:hypothetical protein
LAGLLKYAWSHRVKRFALLFLLTCMVAPELSASTLNTPSFVIEIQDNCPEGSVSCDDVSYVGTSRKTGKSLSLKGRTIHTRCRDGSLCRFLGYEFKAGKVLYRALNEGRLEVTQGDKILVDEKGEWDW